MQVAWVRQLGRLPPDIATRMRLLMVGLEAPPEWSQPPFRGASAWDDCLNRAVLVHVRSLSLEAETTNISEEPEASRAWH